MPVLQGETVIRASCDVVFDPLADARSEPQYNRSILSVGLLSPAPIRACTRSLLRSRLGSVNVEVETDVTAYERPRRFRYSLPVLASTRAPGSVLRRGGRAHVRACSRGHQNALFGSKVWWVSSGMGWWGLKGR